MGIFYFLQLLTGAAMEVDSAFLDSLRRMEEVALAQVFDRYALALYNYIMLRCQDSVLADNIVGDVFSRLLEHLSSGNGPRSNLRSYLFETAYNILVDQIRYSQRRMSLETLAIPLTGEPVIQKDIENQILCDDVWEVIQSELTDYQRHVIILRFLEGFSLRETAEILGKSVNTIKVAQNRAVMTLRKSLDQWSMV
jgi:RNA polymerase sigma-70 factor (ECF subfamily)